MVQWLRFRAPNAGGLGWIPGQGTRACMSQLKDPARGNETKTRRSQVSLKKKKNGQGILAGDSGEQQSQG